MKRTTLWNKGVHYLVMNEDCYLWLCHWRNGFKTVVTKMQILFVMTFFWKIKIFIVKCNYFLRFRTHFLFNFFFILLRLFGMDTHILVPSIYELTLTSLYRIYLISLFMPLELNVRMQYCSRGMLLIFPCFFVVFCFQCPVIGVLSVFVCRESRG